MGYGAFDRLAYSRQIVRKPLASGNLHPTDFSFDLSKLPATFRGSDFAFQWCIEAITGPEEPWMIMARSAWRTGLVY